MFIQGIWRFFPQKTLFAKSQGNSHCCSSPETTPQSFGTLPPQTVFSAFKLHHNSLRYFSIFPLLVRHRFEFLLLICCHWNLYLYFTHVSNNLMQTKTGSEILPLVRFAFHLIQFLLSALGCFWLLWNWDAFYLSMLAHWCFCTAFYLISFRVKPAPKEKRFTSSGGQNINRGRALCPDHTIPNNHTESLY